jgi:hypothetical protein
MNASQVGLILACVTAVATMVYGLATFLLWQETRRDRKQREKQFEIEETNRKLRDLLSAFYEAWGLWNGHGARSASSVVDSAQAGKIFEAFIRLECQLRLNDLANEANNLGLSIRTLEHVDESLAEIGVALGLLPSKYEYRRPSK